MGHFNGKILTKRMRRVTWPGGMGLSKTTYLESALQPQFTCHCITFMSLRWRLRGVPWEHPIDHCKAILGRKFCKSCQKRAKNGAFSGIRGLNVIFLFSNPVKAHPCPEPVVWPILRENRFRGLGCWKNPEKRSRINIFDALFRTYGEKKPLEGSWLILRVGRYPWPDHVLVTIG